MNETAICHYHRRAEPIAHNDGKGIDTEGVRARAESLHGGKVSHALVSLIVTLERMIKSEISVERRLELVKAIEPQVIRAAVGIPKPVVPARQSDARSPNGQTLEQRVYCLTATNLTLALEALDRSPLAFTDTAAIERRWLVTHLFDIFRQAIEFCVRWDRPWPPHVWKQVHDLRFYLASREDIALGAEGAVGEIDFDPDQEYKCLILLGLIAWLVRPEDRSAVLFQALSLWAKQSRLCEPRSHGSLFTFYLVDLSRDEPLRLGTGALPDFNGWVLEPAQALLEYVAALHQ